MKWKNAPKIVPVFQYFTYFHIFTQWNNTWHTQITHRLLIRVILSFLQFQWLFWLPVASKIIWPGRMTGQRKPNGLKKMWPSGRPGSAYFACTECIDKIASQLWPAHLLYCYRKLVVCSQKGFSFVRFLIKAGMFFHERYGWCLEWSWGCGPNRCPLGMPAFAKESQVGRFHFNQQQHNHHKYKQKDKHKHHHNHHHHHCARQDRNYTFSVVYCISGQLWLQDTKQWIAQQRPRARVTCDRETWIYQDLLIYYLISINKNHQKPFALNNKKRRTIKNAVTNLATCDIRYLWYNLSMFFWP